MGQQPNIELEQSDAPRRKLVPGPARPWRPIRPGDLNSPAEVPVGGAFGIIGPDAGYALKLVADREMTLLPGEHHHDAAVAVAAVAAARAALLGRAPIADDVSVGLIVLGLGADSAVDPDVLAYRPDWIGNVGHDAAKLRSIISDVPADVLEMTPAALRDHVASGWIYRRSEGAE